MASVRSATATGRGQDRALCRPFWRARPRRPCCWTSCAKSPRRGAGRRGSEPRVRHKGRGVALLPAHRNRRTDEAVRGPTPGGWRRTSMGDSATFRTVHEPACVPSRRPAARVRRSPGACIRGVIRPPPAALPRPPLSACAPCAHGRERHTFQQAPREPAPRGEIRCQASLQWASRFLGEPRLPGLRSTWARKEPPALRPQRPTCSRAEMRAACSGR